MSTVRDPGSSPGVRSTRRRSALVVGLVGAAFAVIAPMAALASSGATAPAGASPDVTDADTGPIRGSLSAKTTRPRLVGDPTIITIRTPVGPTPASPIRIPGTLQVGPAAATFSVAYSSNYPTDARLAFQAAVDTWAANLYSTQPINIQANWVDLGNNITLGQTSVPVIGLTDGFRYPVALAEALCVCEVPNTTYEMTIDFNSRFSFYKGTDGVVPTGLIDLETIALHEIGHGVGYNSNFNVVSGLGTWGSGSPARYDTYVYSSATGGSALIDTTFVANNSVALATQLTDGSVYFNGPVATLKNGGARPH